MSDIVIVGGGIIGLLTAWELASSGAEIKLLERGKIGREASWAGGGIVSPLYPWRYNQAVSALSHWAQDRYPQLALQLLQQSGIDPEFNPCGLLMLDAKDSAEAIQWARENRRPLQVQDREQIYTTEPNLGPGFEQGLWMPTVGNIRNPRLLQALKQSLLGQKNVSLHEGCEVLSFLQSAESTVRLQTSSGTVDAGKVVFASGAWTAALLESKGIKIHTEPVKGEMLLFKAQPWLLNRIVLNNGRYVIPRMDGHVLVGSSLARQGFDKSPTEAVKKELLQVAYRLVPGLEDFPLLNHWAGLRPGAPEGVPYIGAVPGFENVFVNAGHYRNGLVLAPASARLMADLILGNQPQVDPTPYQLNRGVAEEGA